jgi:geranylgeranyl pyrophosphate synthase
VAIEGTYLRIRSRLEPALSARVSEILAGIPAADLDALEAALTRGKKIRGALLCLVAEAFGGNLERALPRAVAVELVQAATLIHDDVIDRDTLRRGHPAVWVVEGVHRAILVGDLLFATAIRMMGDLGREDGVAISRAIANTARGACLEPIEPSALRTELGSGFDPRERYEAIIRLKTGSLFGAACRMGAHAARAAPEQAKAVERYGLRLGEAYQIADDLQDIRVCLASGSLDPRQAAPLLPALLASGHAGPSTVLDAAVEGRWDAVLPLFGAAAEALERELSNRIALAVKSLDGSLPRGAAAELLRQAPEGFLGLFSRELSLL